MRRFSRIFCLSVLAAGSALPAQRLKSFPFFNRSDPKIETRVFVDAPQLRLACKEVGVLPFSRSNQPDHKAPPFETFLRQALLQSAKAEMIDAIPTLPWDNLPAWKVRELTDADRIGAVAGQGYSRKLDLVILGSVDVLFRKPSKGLVAGVTVRVISYARRRSPLVRNETRRLAAPLCSGGLPSAPGLVVRLRMERLAEVGCSLSG